ncbi:MAG: hypothetical protein R3B70_30575 [Polyangiaceae bacterium]
MFAALDSCLRAVEDFKGARDAASPKDRLREVRLRANRLRERMLGGKVARFYASRGLIRVPYPSRYAFLNAFSLPTPFVHILNRVFVIQVDTEQGVKTLLASPSDIHANAETPFFKRLASGMGPFQEIGKKFLGPEISTVEVALGEIGIRPEQVDYISYDHLHTQDVRKWLGSGEKDGYFPNAKLLVMRQEWESTQGLLPPQLDWYCPSGVEGIHPSRVVLLDGDTMLGESVLLMKTPGHTEGNHSFVVHTPEGLMVTSENGVAPDAYAPLASKIPGVASYAKKTGAEVILNGNTLEGGLDQYISMVQEKEVAGPSRRNPEFPNMACSSELAAYWAFPGSSPTMSFGDLTFGQAVR